MRDILSGECARRQPVVHAARRPIGVRGMEFSAEAGS